MSIAILAIAGSLGALSRFGLAGAVQRSTRLLVPVGTFVVNIVGCFGLGVVVGGFHTDAYPVVFVVGFFGGFTTFSTWAIETVRLDIAPKPSRSSVINFLGMPALGVLVAAIGYFLAT